VFILRLLLYFSPRAHHSLNRGGEITLNMKRAQTTRGDERKVDKKVSQELQSIAIMIKGTNPTAD